MNAASHRTVKPRDHLCCRILSTLLKSSCFGYAASSGNKCPFPSCQMGKAQLTGTILATGVSRKSNLCFIISLHFCCENPTPMYFGFKLLKAFNLQDQNQSSLHERYNADTEGSQLLQTSKLLHPSVPKCDFLETNLHLLARSSSKASDHSWASSGEGLQKGKENIRPHCSSFTASGGSNSIASSPLTWSNCGVSPPS